MGDTPVNVLFVNHREQACGVQQMGQRLYYYIEQSKRYKSYYIDIENGQEFRHWASELQPAIVLYNFYSGATMPWLTPGLVQSQRHKFKQLSIFHELPLGNMGFDLLLHQDPTNEDTNYANLTRPIPVYRSKVRSTNKLPTIGSFGFGLGGKGFNALVERVCAEYDSAIIRLNIPYAAFGDKNGNGARQWAQTCNSISKPGIELRISHNLLPETELIDWLASNDINCFFYEENYGRGISGTIDYALAACKPIAITKSWQFKHIWRVNDDMLIDKHSLQELLTGGDNGQYFRDLWSPDKLTSALEAAFDRVLGYVS